jgi:hypothetical protein
MKTFFKPLFLFIVILSFGCASTNSSKISSKVNESDNTYVYTCRFSEEYFSQIKNIIKNEYPSFGDNDFQYNNSSVRIVLLNNKKLEMVHKHYSNRDDDFSKMKRIVEKIDKLKG